MAHLHQFVARKALFTLSSAEHLQGHLVLLAILLKCDSMCFNIKVTFSRFKNPQNLNLKIREISDSGIMRVRAGLEFRSRMENGLLLYMDDGGYYDFLELKLTRAALRYAIRILG